MNTINTSFVQNQLFFREKFDGKKLYAYRDSIASDNFFRISSTRASCLSISSFEIVVEAIRGCSGLMYNAGSASGLN